MSRLRTTLLVALAAHAVTLVAFARAVRPTHAPAAPEEPIEVAIEPGEPARVIEPSTPATPMRDVVPSVRAPLASSAAASLAPRSSASAGASAGADAVLTRAPGATPSAEPWSFAPTRPDLSLSASARYGAPAPAGDRAAPRPAQAPRWSTAADEADVTLGLTRGGAALAVARDLTREGTTPIDGYAILDAIADALGTVTDVRVVDVSADRPSWEEVARRMIPAMAAKRFTVPPGARGLVVRIRIESKWQYPNGRSARGPQPSPVVKAALLPLTVALGQDPTERDQPVRFVSARVLEERPL